MIPLTLEGGTSEKRKVNSKASEYLELGVWES